MPNEPGRRVARVDKSELSAMPEGWTHRERGRHLRRLLERKGIAPDRLFAVEYFPKHQCWVLTQDAEAAAPPGAAPPAQPEEVFYLQTVTEFRRPAGGAFASLAARSAHFASFGCDYQLPEKP